MAYGARLESELSESSQGFESPILRQEQKTSNGVAPRCDAVRTEREAQEYRSGAHSEVAVATWASLPQAIVLLSRS